MNDSKKSDDAAPSLGANPTPVDGVTHSETIGKSPEPNPVNADPSPGLGEPAPAPVDAGPSLPPPGQGGVAPDPTGVSPDPALPNPVTTNGQPPAFDIVFHRDAPGDDSKSPQPGVGELPYDLAKAFATIEGFRSGTDKLDFSDLDANGDAAGVPDFTFAGELTAADSALAVGEVGWFKAGEDVGVAFNDASVPEPWIIELAQVNAALTQADFIL